MLAASLLTACYGDVPSLAVETVDAGDTTATSAAAADVGAADVAPEAPTPDVEAPDVEDPAPAPREYFADGGYMLANAHANVIRAFTFFTMDDDGVADGFDLDGLQSEDGDPAGCGHPDLTSPEGTEGVDNQLAKVWVAVGPIVGVQVENLLHGAINEGKVLLLVELEGVDDLVNDDDITVHVFRGILDPLIGTQGLISPAQTFYLDPDFGVSTVTGASIVDGEIDAGPVEFQLPIEILDADFVLKIRDGRIRVRIDEAGGFHGIAGGAISVPELTEELSNTGGNAEVQIVAPIFASNADLAPKGDGDCDLFSVAIGIEGVHAFVVRYPEAGDR